MAEGNIEVKEDISVLEEAREKYIEITGVIPDMILMAPDVYEEVKQLIQLYIGKRVKSVEEILGMKVSIEDTLPAKQWIIKKE